MATYMISIHRQYFDAIASGEKRWELRTRIPKRLASGDTILICQPKSNGKVVGSFVVDTLWSTHPAKAWAAFREDFAITEDAYATYFAGRSLAYMIGIADVHIFSRPRHISDYGVKVAPMWFTEIHEI